VRGVASLTLENFTDAMPVQLRLTPTTFTSSTSLPSPKTTPSPVDALLRRSSYILRLLPRPVARHTTLVGSVEPSGASSRVAFLLSSSCLYERASDPWGAHPFSRSPSHSFRPEKRTSVQSEETGGGRGEKRTPFDSPRQSKRASGTSTSSLWSSRRRKVVLTDR
jgi:hypothetical protein